MALAERQSAYHRTIIEVVYRTMERLADGTATSSAEVYELRQQLREAMPWWRGLLRVHEPDEVNRCRSCRRWFGGNRVWPCPIWRDAIDALNNLNNMYGFLVSVPPSVEVTRPEKQAKPQTSIPRQPTVRPNRLPSAPSARVAVRREGRS